MSEGQFGQNGRQKGRTILLFSLEPWGAMWYSKHHYAVELARHHTVFFISPPDKWRLRDLFRSKLERMLTPEGVLVVQYRNPLPLSAVPPFVARWIQRCTARKLARLLPGDGGILWCFHPTPLATQPVFKGSGIRMIYHVVDPYHSFPENIPCARAADLVVAVNPWFQEHYSKINPATILIPHGIRAKDLDHDPEQVAANRNHWGDYLVMAAGINQWTNYSLLIALVKALPAHKLVLVGPCAPLTGALAMQRNALLGRPNVVHAGVKHPDDLRQIIHGARFGLIAYEFLPREDRPSGPTRTPLKAINYLAQLRPVVTSVNCFIPGLDRRGVFKAEDESEFIRIAQEILSGKLLLDRDAVMHYLGTVTYDRLVGLILGKLKEGEDDLKDRTP